MRERSLFLQTLLTAAILALSARTSWAILIDFESLMDSEAITNQFASDGVTFANAVVITAGISLNEFDFPPHSGVNVATTVDNSQPMMLSFSTPFTSVSGWVTYNDQLTFMAFGPGGNLLTTFNSGMTSNLGSNEYFAIAGLGSIGSIKISQSGSNLDQGFTLDDVNLAAPEPASLLLLGSGVGSLVLRRSRRLRQLASRVKSSQ